MKGYPAWFYRVLLAILITLFITGCLLTPTVLDLKLDWNVPWRLSDSQRVGVAALHAAFAFLAAGLVGSIWSVHMRAGWKKMSNHISGTLLTGLLALLLLSCVGIYYFGDEQWALSSSVGHTLIGIPGPLFLIYHIWSGRRASSHQKMRHKVHKRSGLKHPRHVQQDDA